MKLKTEDIFSYKARAYDPHHWAVATVCSKKKWSAISRSASIGAESSGTYVLLDLGVCGLSYVCSLIIWILPDYVGSREMRECLDASTEAHRRA